VLSQQELGYALFLGFRYWAGLKRKYLDSYKLWNGQNEREIVISFLKKSLIFTALIFRFEDSFLVTVKMYFII
jgi:hypothetical protein